MAEELEQQSLHKSVWDSSPHKQTDTDTFAQSRRGFENGSGYYSRLAAAYVCSSFSQSSYLNSFVPSRKVPAMFTNLNIRFRTSAHRLLSQHTTPGILNSYVQTLPSPQNAINIFKGEWASKLPAPFDKLDAGWAPIFEDPRIEWQTKEIGGFEDKSVLDLGPLEGGHAYMFEKRGAREIVSIEGNPRAFLKCLSRKSSWFKKSFLSLRGFR